MFVYQNDRQIVFIKLYSCFFPLFSVKDEVDHDSDNLAALAEFKDEDLKQFEDTCNNFSNGMSMYPQVNYFFLSQRKIRNFQSQFETFG